MRASVTFLDVGQGDCTLVVDLDEPAALIIDCPGGSLGDVLILLDQAGVARPDLLVITHSDLDHMAGAVELARTRGTAEVRYNPDRPLPPTPEDRNKWRAALRAIAGLADDGTRVEFAVAGVTGSVGAVTYRLLSPTPAMVSMAQAIADPNRASAIVRIEAGPLVVLVGGDADGAAWRRLIDAGVELAADVFRVPHHAGDIGRGPRHASWDELLEAVNAAVHVVSVGTRNTYGHPTREALDALQRRAPAARVMCTEVNYICAGGSILPPSSRLLPIAAKVGAGDRPGACRCAGTVRVEVTETGWAVIPSVGEHRAVIDLLASPMCMPATTA
jgi:competence protein ComEC